MLYDTSLMAYDDGTVVDYDGNIYTTVTICNQTWLVENLRVTHFNDGTPISYLDEENPFSEPRYAWYDDSIGYKNPYGALYNYNCIDPSNSGGKNICPSGWHVPSASEWCELFVCASTLENNRSLAGQALKETGLDHWGYDEPTCAGSGNIADNLTGFTAVGTGIWFDPSIRPSKPPCYPSRYERIKWQTYMWSMHWDKGDAKLLESDDAKFDNNVVCTTFRELAAEAYCPIRCIKDT